MSDLVIVGHGARTPIGLTAESAAAAARAGISRVREHPHLVDSHGDALTTAFDGRLDGSVLGWKRLVTLGTSALIEALAKVLRRRLRAPRMTALVALPELRPGFSAEDARQTIRGIQDASAAAGFRIPVESVGSGHAGALHGLQDAAERLLRGESDLVFVGGVESYLEPDTLDWLEAQRRLAIEGIRSGFHPGEAAAFVVLGRGSVARELGLAPLARLRGAGSTVEHRSLDKGVEVLGEGLAAAITTAAAPLRPPQEVVDAIFCDINGERYRSQEWAMAVLRLRLDIFPSRTYEAPVNLWGDVGAASGALGCVLAVQSWARDYARGPRAMVWGSSDAGLRAAAVLERIGRT